MIDIKKLLKSMINNGYNSNETIYNPYFHYLYEKQITKFMIYDEEELNMFLKENNLGDLTEIDIEKINNEFIIIHKIVEFMDNCNEYTIQKYLLLSYFKYLQRGSFINMKLRYNKIHVLLVITNFITILEFPEIMKYNNYDMKTLFIKFFIFNLDYPSIQEFIKITTFLSRHAVARWPQWLLTLVEFFKRSI